jgi:hypothetical protein
MTSVAHLFFRGGRDQRPQVPTRPTTATTFLWRSLRIIDNLPNRWR